MIVRGLWGGGNDPSRERAETSRHNAKKSPGPLAYENWERPPNSEDIIPGVEILLFSDARFTGLELTFGPYRLINTLAQVGSRDGEIAPGLALRIGHLTRFEIPSMEEKSTERHHGGSLADEIAALLALCYGVRLKVGYQTREFGSDPVGTPIAYQPYQAPLFARNYRREVLPGFVSVKPIDQAVRLQKLRALISIDANILVRAARLYQEAVWVAEADASLSWLLLVSAAEVCAGHWDKDVTSPIQRVREFLPPKVVTRIEASDTTLLDDLARPLSRLVKATSKFVSFLLAFLPSPPEIRPPDHFRVSFEAEQLRKALGTIYAHRSEALHDGTPFPISMCDGILYHDKGVSEEKPSGLASASASGVWLAEDCPMHLHIFAYIVRGAILNWWDGLSAGPEP